MRSTFQEVATKLNIPLIYANPSLANIKLDDLSHSDFSEDGLVFIVSPLYTTGVPYDSFGRISRPFEIGVFGILNLDFNDEDADALLTKCERVFRSIVKTLNLQVNTVNVVPLRFDVGLGGMYANIFYTNKSTCESIDIGGENLFTDSEGEIHIDNSAGTDNAVVFEQKVTLTRKTEYVVSFDVKGSGAVTFLAYLPDYPIISVGSNGELGVGFYGTLDFTLTGTWKRVWVKITTGNWASETVSKPLRIRAKAGADVYVRKIKLEKGSIATPWTPAPEDYEITEVVSETEPHHDD